MGKRTDNGLVHKQNERIVMNDIETFCETQMKNNFGNYVIMVYALSATSGNARPSQVHAKVLSI